MTAGRSGQTGRGRSRGFPIRLCLGDHGADTRRGARNVQGTGKSREEPFEKGPSRGTTEMPAVHAGRAKVGLDLSMRGSRSDAIGTARVARNSTCTR